MYLHVVLCRMVLMVMQFSMTLSEHQLALADTVQSIPLVFKNGQ